MGAQARSMEGAGRGRQGARDQVPRILPVPEGVNLVHSSLEEISAQNHALMSKQYSFRLSCSTKTPDFQNLYLFQGSRLEPLERNKFASQKHTFLIENAVD